jgi:hypothetical protein
MRVAAFYNFVTLSIGYETLDVRIRVSQHAIWAFRTVSNGRKQIDLKQSPPMPVCREPTGRRICIP